MPCWYYDKNELKNTPSATEGIDYDTECRYRREGARFIIDAGTKMVLGCNTMATGVVYFHRFYMFHSFRQFPRYVTACCCLFLAGKVEETPKKCSDIIEIAQSLLSPQKFATFGEDPREEVMTLERILLQTIKFDLQVKHPYSYLTRYAKCLKGDKDMLQTMVQMAWSFANDSLCTTLCLQWEPEIVAVALMYLAGKLSKFEVIDWEGRVSKHLRWWDMFVEDVTLDLLEDICHQVLDLYSPQQQTMKHMSDSPPPQPRPITQPPPKPTPTKIPPASTPTAVPIPVKVTTGAPAVAPVKNGSDPPPDLKDLQIPKTAPPPEVPPQYLYPPGAALAAYPPTFPPPTLGAPHLATPQGPPPHLPPPGVYPPYYTTVVGAPFYQAQPGAPPPPHRAYYPPST